MISSEEAFVFGGEQTETFFFSHSQLFIIVRNGEGRLKRVGRTEGG